MTESFFWKDKEKKIIKQDLFSEQANKIAKEISDDGKDERGNDKKNNSSQLRKFYDEIMNFKVQLNSNHDDIIFAKKLPYIKMLNAKFSYSFGRGYISNKCFNFFRDRINEIKDYDDFTAFADFFEAFMGFYKQYRKK